LLLEAMHVNKGDTVVADLLKFLHEYAQYHFSEEEKHMLESRCPIYEEHKRAHEEFVKNLMELQALYDRLGASTIVVMHLQRWLIDWLIEHIIHVDKQMAAEVRHD
ncbi:hemerythrin family protein, partial [bacterium]|nr:hemerythrin family protein [bacterium]